MASRAQIAHIARRIEALRPTGHCSTSSRTPEETEEQALARYEEERGPCARAGRLHRYGCPEVTGLGQVVGEPLMTTRARLARLAARIDDLARRADQSAEGRLCVARPG